MVVFLSSTRSETYRYDSKTRRMKVASLSSSACSARRTTSSSCVLSTSNISSELRILRHSNTKKKEGCRPHPWDQSVDLPWPSMGPGLPKSGKSSWKRIRPPARRDASQRPLRCAEDGRPTAARPVDERPDAGYFRPPPRATTEIDHATASCGTAKIPGRRTKAPSAPCHGDCERRRPRL